jgi:hypothetical protein
MPHRALVVTFKDGDGADDDGARLAGGIELDRVDDETTATLQV